MPLIHNHFIHQGMFLAMPKVRGMRSVFHPQGGYFKFSGKGEYVQFFGEKRIIPGNKILLLATARTNIKG